jgi:hypothetical protein
VALNNNNLIKTFKYYDTLNMVDLAFFKGFSKKDRDLFRKLALKLT